MRKGAPFVAIIVFPVSPLLAHKAAVEAMKQFGYVLDAAGVFDGSDREGVRRSNADL